MQGMDSEVIKSYVALGCGIGIIPTVATHDSLGLRLRAINLSHLFQPHLVKICFSKIMHLNQHTYDFITCFSPHLNQALVKTVLAQPDQDARDELLATIVLPIY